MYKVHYYKSIRAKKMKVKQQKDYFKRTFFTGQRSKVSITKIIIDVTMKK